MEKLYKGISKGRDGNIGWLYIQNDNGTYYNKNTKIIWNQEDMEKLISEGKIKAVSEGEIYIEMFDVQHDRLQLGGKDSYRVIHLPTGLVTEWFEDRNPFMSRMMAMESLFDQMEAMNEIRKMKDLEK